MLLNFDDDNIAQVVLRYILLHISTKSLTNISQPRTTLRPHISITNFHTTPDLKPRLDLLLRILQCPITRLILTPHRPCLLLRKPLCLRGRVIPQPIHFTHRRIIQLGRLFAVRPSIHRHDRRAAQSQVVLQAVLGPRDMPVIRPPAQVPDQLRTLGQPRGAQRVALGDESPRRVNHNLAAIGNVPVADQLVRFSRFRKPQRINRHHFIRAEAIVQLADAALVWANACLGEREARGVMRHVEPDEVDGAARKQRGRVGREALACNQHGLVAEVRARVEKVLGDEDSGGAAVRGRAALELGEGLVDHGRGEDLVARVDVLELRVGVVYAVGVVDAGDFGKIFEFGAVSGTVVSFFYLILVRRKRRRRRKEEKRKGEQLLLHVLPSRVTKHLRRTRSLGEPPRRSHHQPRRARWVLPIIKKRLQTTRHHLFEPHNHHAVGGAAGDILATNGETGGPRRAVVVDIDNGDLGHAKLVKDALAAGRVAVAVAGDALLDVVVGDVCVEEGLDACFEAELGVVDLAAGLDELGHAHAEDVDGGFLFGSHGGLVAMLIRIKAKKVEDKYWYSLGSVCD